MKCRCTIFHARLGLVRIPQKASSDKLSNEETHELVITLEKYQLSINANSVIEKPNGQFFGLIVMSH
jgi:hypothetical protein